MGAIKSSVSRRSKRLAACGLVLIVAGACTLTYLQFRGSFTPAVPITLISHRAGLSMNPGSKVTFNGVAIGRVADIAAIDVNGEPMARFTIDLDPVDLHLIPRNVQAEVKANTVFGNKYVALRSPQNPSEQPLAPNAVIDISSVTTEFNTLFETVLSIAQKVDPIKLNQTLTATAQALDGLGQKFGSSIGAANDVLAELNPRMPQINHDTKQLADVLDTYADASPDLWSALQDSVTTARSLNAHRSDLDSALLASVGFGNTAGDVFERGGPYFVRAAKDLVPTSQLFNQYSPELFCTIRNYADTVDATAAAGGGNGYSIVAYGTLLGGPNPYVYPDNLPRVNAKGGPEGRPGCWQKIDRNLWPAPYLVADTGVSIAPYNHFALGQPLITEYVWGRQFGENTINP
ncbi:MCE family protein [Mycolicibacterium sp. CBM1]